MMDSSLQEEITKILVNRIGDGKVLWEKTDLTPYTRDGYNIRSDEDCKYFPDLVVFPEMTSDVQEIVRIAAKYKIPLIPKGGGSNRAGMLVPIHGGIIVDTIKMNCVIEVDAANLSVTVQPGITLKELDEHLARYGLALNQEQGSIKVATVGGSISTSGFSRKYQKYGTIVNRIMSLEVVLADGRVLRTGPKVLYTSTGYRLHQLFIGAEGTLGIITEATLRVEPLPEAKDAILAFYDDFWAARDAALKVMATGVTCTGAEVQEIGEESELNAPENKKGIFLIIFEGTKEEVRAEVDFVKKIVEKTKGVFGNHDEALRQMNGYELLWCGTRATTIGYEDNLMPYIPMDKMREFYDKLWDQIMPKYGIKPLPGERYENDIGRYSMAYSQFYIPSGKDGWMKHKEVKREIAKLVTGLGGSIASCVGVGIAERDNLDLEFSEVALDIMREIKHALDPDNIMNPGKKIPMKTNKKGISKAKV